MTPFDDLIGHTNINEEEDVFETSLKNIFFHNERKPQCDYYISEHS